MTPAYVLASRTPKDPRGGARLAQPLHPPGDHAARGIALDGTLLPNLIRDVGLLRLENTNPTPSPHSAVDR